MTTIDSQPHSVRVPRCIDTASLDASVAPDPAALPELLTTTEAAEFLRVGRRVVANWCGEGKTEIGSIQTS